MACQIIRDTYGTMYRIPQAPHVKTPTGHMLAGSPQVDVWWDRDNKKKQDEHLIILQDQGEKADVIQLTLGQVYDLIHALGWAVMKP